MPRDTKNIYFSKIPKDLEKPLDFTLANEGEYENLELDKDDFRDTAFTALELKDCYLKNCNLNHLKISKLSLVNVRFENCDLANLETKELYAKNVDFVKCRMTGFIASESVMAEMSYKNCQLKLAQFRFAKLKYILFDNCLLN